jgi:Uri superfamily endonuclease
MKPYKIEVFNGSNIDFNKIYSNIRKGNYRYIGSGSGRTVYDLGNGYVVKSAKNKKGLAQNKVEYNISSSDSTDLFAKAIGASEGFGLLVAEKAEKIKSISVVWYHFDVKNNSELYRLKILQEAAYKYGLLLRDLGRPVNWGQINGRPVIVDYGFTREVRKKYYMPSLFKIFRRQIRRMKM